MKRHKNRICKRCGKKFKEHPHDKCDWKPKLWSDRFKPHIPFLTLI